MRNLLLTISYKGTNYHGFQVQKNAVTVCQVLQAALESIVNHDVEIKGCSRTDTGVHANEYCLSFKTNVNIGCLNIVRALNIKLPNDIVATNCKDVENDFHARYSCIGKEYIYKIWNHNVPSPFFVDLMYYYKYHIDEEMLNEEAKSFIGTYNFKSFRNLKKGKNDEDTIRTITKCKVKRDGDVVIIEISGDGFLYNMVRIIVGTLIFIQEGKIKQGMIPYIIASKDRSLAGKTMAARGLYLNKVFY